jgi:hypothetical protein
MADPTLPSEFFTPASILTLTGATGAVYVVCGALQWAFNFNPRWLALAISVLIALVGAYVTQPASVGAYVLALVNGCLICCTAVGVNNVFAQAGNGQGGGGRPGGLRSAHADDVGLEATAKKRKFNTAWW